MRPDQEQNRWKEWVGMAIGVLLGTATSVIIIALIINALLNAYLKSAEADRLRRNLPGHVAPAPDGPPGQ